MNIVVQKYATNEQFLLENVVQIEVVKPEAQKNINLGYKKKQRFYHIMTCDKEGIDVKMYPIEEYLILPASSLAE